MGHPPSIWRYQNGDTKEVFNMTYFVLTIVGISMFYIGAVLDIPELFYAGAVVGFGPIITGKFER